MKREHIVLLAVNAAMLLGFGSAYVARMNHEFIIFIGIIVLFVAVIAATTNRVEYTLDALIGLTVWSGLHLAGGLVPVGDGRLYDTILLPLSDSYPVLRYDQVVHIWGFGTATLIMFCLLKPMLRGARLRRIALDIVIVMAGLGVGALNEVVEYVVQEIVPQSGIGGYQNTMLDLCADLVGALLALGYVRALHFKDLFVASSPATQCTPTRFTVVRHGETEWNTQGRQQGWLDSPLTSRGLAQARALADRLEGQSFDALYSSDLGRAVRTAEIIGTATGLKVRMDERLRERHLGVFQGLTWEEAETKHPRAVAHFRRATPDWPIPGGESADQRRKRNLACMDDLAAKHPGEHLLVVVHGGVLDGLMRTAMRFPLAEPRRFKLLNAALNVFIRDADGWVVETWGDVAHLREIGTEDDR